MSLKYTIHGSATELTFLDGEDVLFRENGREFFCRLNLNRGTWEVHIAGHGDIIELTMEKLMNGTQSLLHLDGPIDNYKSRIETQRYEGLGGSKKTKRKRKKCKTKKRKFNKIKYI